MRSSVLLNGVCARLFHFSQHFNSLAFMCYGLQSLRAHQKPVRILDDAQHSTLGALNPSDRGARLTALPSLSASWLDEPL